MDQATQTDDADLSPSNPEGPPPPVANLPNPEYPTDELPNAGHPKGDQPKDVPDAAFNPPGSNSKKKKALIVGGIVAGSIVTAVGVAVAAPVAIPAAVAALGFEAGGIVAGSTAASLMSLGGGVTPVAVSVLQSIGATGLISGTTAAGAGAAGGGIFAGVSAAFLAIVKKKAHKATQTD